MEDVAAAAGVSRSSVSRVFLGQGKVSDATRERVFAVAEWLGYVPNVMASELASRGSSVVGLLLRDAANPAYGLLFTRLQEAAHDASITLISMTISGDPRGSRQIDSLRRLMGMRVAGLIVATGGVTSAQLEPFRERIPIVRAGRPEETGHIHAVSYDEHASARALAAHVADQGHRSVALIVTQEHASYPEYVRATNTAAELAARGVRIVPLPAVALTDGIADVIDLVRRREITAVMCPADLRALNVLRALDVAGLSAPGDVSVTGCDAVLPGIDLMGLTSYRIGVERLAERAVANIAALIGDHPPSGTIRELVPGRLVPGRTVAPPPTASVGIAPAATLEQEL
ncbi:LacI family DNA-binding transcriptional regulator [Microbacterium oryzae]|uniref:LacI family DNA-binding transcriptional regulator n=1 Tax=Microbacterium oryzae TaxID=743009 RepID=UPI0025B03D6F|nr:LacI family DNA-binding transcriptional regulator [Microbacterium oryzae]MDN3309318.1 LacI family DNA-binding transcriptional regulator [Microbacterium oryzae]